MPNKTPAALAVAVALLLTAGCAPPRTVQPPHILPQPVLTTVSTHGITVPVTIGGKPYRFLLDTGASYTTLDNRLAAAITQPTPEAQIPQAYHMMFTDGIKTTDGSLNRDDIELWQPLPMQIGSYAIHGADPWLGLDMTLLSQAFGQQLDGILGIEVFRQLSWAVDNRSKTLTVWQHAPSTLAYQQCVPYSDSYGRSPQMELNFNKDWAVFSVDTGAYYTMISDEGLSYLREQGANVILAQQDVASAAASGIVSNNNYLIDNLSFNHMPLGRLTISVSKTGLSNLGMNFLTRFDDYLFIPNKMQFCYNASQFTRHDKKPVRYIGLRYLEGHIEVFSNRPADVAPFGLLNGDRLLAVNGERADPTQIDDLREQLSTTPAGGMKLQIERNGQTMAVSF